MAEYVRGFVIPEIADVHLMFAKVIRKAEEATTRLRGGPYAPAAAATLAQLRAAYVDFNDGLELAARKTASDAVRGMREQLAATQVRPETDATPHLRDLLVARPLTVGGSVQTGMVGVADVGQLELAINPRSPGYGPYWRAQEYGTGTGFVPSQVGRVFFGEFMLAGGGDATPPQAKYAGGGGPHPVFQSSRQEVGGVGGSRTKNYGRGGGYLGQGDYFGEFHGGYGTIGAEIQPRHFIAYGADSAVVKWREQIEAIQDRAVERILATSGP
jgi:hypothetical protein